MQQTNAFLLLALFIVLGLQLLNSRQSRPMSVKDAKHEEGLLASSAGPKPQVGGVGRAGHQHHFHRNNFTSEIAVSLWTSVLHYPHVSRAVLASHYWVQHFDNWMFNTFDPVSPQLSEFLTQMDFVVPEVEKMVKNQDGRLAQTEALFHEYPNSKWYFLGDADTFAISENLVCYARQLDPNTILFKGYSSQQFVGKIKIINENFHGHISFLVGGGGILMSRAFVYTLAPRIRECRLERQNDGLFEDTRFAICAYGVFWQAIGADGLREFIINRSYLGFSKANDEFVGICKKASKDKSGNVPLITAHLKDDKMVHSFYDLVAKARREKKVLTWGYVCSAMLPTVYTEATFPSQPLSEAGAEKLKLKEQHTCIESFYNDGGVEAFASDGQGAIHSVEFTYAGMKKHD